MHSTMILSSVCLLSVLSSLPAVTGKGTANVRNECDKPVYIWTVDSKSTGPEIVQPNEEYTEDIHVDGRKHVDAKKKAGVAIKISREPNGLFVKNSPQLLLQYNADPPKLWMNLHEINGHPFDGSPLSVAGCGDDITWPTGVNWKDPKGTGNGTTHPSSNELDCGPRRRAQACAPAHGVCAGDLVKNAGCCPELVCMGGICRDFSLPVGVEEHVDPWEIIGTNTTAL
ncbi:uncharacterized protein BDZ99DRAFT_461125 [Mytilinidion resinicola]|uniref:Osmotin, thaumatin-like protein n=1 Tax=Mytilinidion resinicola TaxID=574789 RepID=A0A6A6YU12_9PEZI|nr:uncharacterized protein BDZ99DRAFT_461125 [Mytilinidion resinicola]KAF2812422.1 hypothetical protein BDZ99DRAFT_461125 [Mytilinidion resinicola]